jgi:hypothetical protein
MEQDNAASAQVINCIHCGEAVQEKFCSHCGQRANVKRLTLREGWNDFWARVYGFDGMFPRTLRDLTLRPGQTSRTYISGDRVSFYGPVGYFFLMATLMYLIASMLDVNLADLLAYNGNNGLQPTPKPGSGMEKMMQSMFQKISDNLKALSFILIAIQAYCSRYIFFRKQGLNYIEHLVLPLYVQGHIYWLSILSLVLYKITGKFIPNGVSLVVTILFISYSYADFFKEQGRGKAFFKGFGLYITTQLIFVLVVVVTMVVIIFTNPEVLEMIRPSNNR